MTQATREENISALFEAVHSRELAVSEDEFNAMTVKVLEALGRIKCPSGAEFRDLAERNRHPWIRIMDRLLGEISKNNYPFPFSFDEIEGETMLLIRASHIVEHLSLHWDGFRKQSGGTLKKQLFAAGVLLVNSDGVAKEFERVGQSKKGRFDPRCNHMIAIRMDALRSYGLSLTKVRNDC